MYSVCVVGLGYIGLPTASLLATKGYSVHGVDVNEEVVRAVGQGEILIREPDLDLLVKSAVNSGKLTVSTSPLTADVYIIAVPTPFKDNKAPDLRYVEEAVNGIADVVTPGSLIILESTSPVGTTERIAQWLQALRPDLRVGGMSEDDSDARAVFVAHCPERVLPGQILKELVGNNRIVGGIDALSTSRAAQFYESFVSGQVMRTHARTAELVKLTENTSRDVNIAFANELSLICDKLDIDVWEVIRLANQHPRVNILQPGPGVGGHCIAVDPWFIIDSVPSESVLIRTAREVNLRKTDRVVEWVRSKADRFKAPIIACLGLAFKANIDDCRESPAMDIVQRLVDEKVGKVLAVEPNLRALPDSLKQYDSVELCELNTAIQQADIVVLLVDHRPFYKINRALLEQKIVIDLKGVWRKGNDF